MNGLIIQWGNSYGGKTVDLIAYSNSNYIVLFVNTRTAPYADTYTAQNKTNNTFYKKCTNIQNDENKGAQYACSFVVIGD